jgi:hypothetical protein
MLMRHNLSTLDFGVSSTQKFTRIDRLSRVEAFLGQIKTGLLRANH